MFKKNNLFLLGCFMAYTDSFAWLVFPCCCITKPYMDKPAAPYLLAIGLNLILLRFSAKNTSTKHQTE
jgi:hypothetical protein